MNTNEEPTWIAVDEGLEYFEHPHPFRGKRKEWSARTLKIVQDGHGTLNPLLKLLKDTSKEDKTK